jgi:fatty-acyl-CoA synthase
MITSIDDIHRIEAAGEAAWMPHTGIAQALSAAAAQFGSRPALRCLDPLAPDGWGASWTHAQLVADIARTAGWFNAISGAQAARVGLLSPPTAEAWLALWGAEWRGCAVPINHALRDAHLIALLQAAELDVLVVHADPEAGGLAPDAVRRIAAALPPRCRIVVTHGDLDIALPFAQRHQGPTLPPIDAPSSGPVALYHTGGTTGLPKLAQHTARNQLFAAKGAAAAYDARPEDVILNGFPLFHVAGAIVYGLSMLTSGASIALPPPGGWRNPDFVQHAWRLIDQQGISVLGMVPTVMAMLLQAPGAEAAHHGVRLGLTGGSPLPTGVADAFERQTGIPVRNILGMTETSGVIAIEVASAPRTPGSCGLPVPFCQVRRDARGEVVVQGPNVSPGYTDAARNPGTFEGDGLHTGDLGHLDAQGRLFVTGRAKDVIIRGAHNIDPNTIEEVLCQHPQVAAAAAIGLPDAHAGEVPVAYIQWSGTTPHDEAEVLAWARTRISEAAAVPKFIRAMAALPQTAIGKIYKPELRRLATQALFEQLLTQNGIAAEVQAHDQGGQLQLRFQASQEAARDAVGGLMQAYALDWCWQD